MNHDNTMTDDVQWTTTMPPLNSTTTPVGQNISTTSDFTAFKTLNQIICGIISPLGIVGNVLVLFAFLSKWSKLKTYELFIVSLACADLLGTLVLPCIQLHELSGGSFHAIGSNGCKIIFFLSSSSIFVSSLTLIVVSLDRYIAVKWPFKRRQKLCRILILSTWVVGFCSAMVYVVTDRIQLKKEINNVSTCRYVYDNTTKELEAYKALTLFTFTMENAIPFFMMTVFYSLIVYELRKNTDRNLGSVSEDEMQRRRKAFKKTTKLLLVVVVVFFICVTPFNIFYILYAFDELSLREDLIYPVYVVLSMLMMSNSCVNPLIYGKLLRPFRRRSWKLFISFLNCTGLRIQKQLSSMKHSRTLRTSVSRYETEYSQRQTDKVNNNNDNFNKRLIDKKITALSENGKVTENVLPIGRKLAIRHCHSEVRFDFEMRGKMVPLTEEQLDADEDKSLLVDDIYFHDLSHGTPDRETIL